MIAEETFDGLDDHFGRGRDPRRRDNLIAYWRTSILTRAFSAIDEPWDFDPGKQGGGGDDPEQAPRWGRLGLDEFLRGVAPRPFVNAVFEALDIRTDRTNERRRRANKPPLAYPEFFQAEYAGFTLPAHAGPDRKRITEVPAYGMAAVYRDCGMQPLFLADNAYPPPIWLARRYFADSDYNARPVKFCSFADYLQFVSSYNADVDGWPGLLRFFDETWQVATGSSFRPWAKERSALGGRGEIDAGWIRYGISDKASLGLMRMYDDLRDFVKSGGYTPVFDQFCMGGRGTRFTVDLQKKRFLLGHAGGIAGLSPSQRQCASAFVSTKEGEILAVNGPPGTGKTTMLRSVVADLVVRAALADYPQPPVIIACAATNQAITNVLETFARGNDNMGPDLGILAERWIEGLETYGAYMRSSRRAAERWPHQMMILEPQGDFTPPRREGGGQLIPKEVEAARAALDRSRFGAECRYGDLVMHALTDDAVTTWCDYASELLGRDISSPREGMAELKTMLRATVEAVSAMEREIAAFEAISPEHPDRAASFARLRDSLRLTCFGSSQGAADEFMAEGRRIRALDASADHASLARGIVDITLRRQAYHLAARWWEAEYLRRLRLRRENARADRLQDFRTAACVTPIFVSTFDRLPAVFNRWQGDRARIMWGEADLLVVDEAGQAGPDRGAAAFAIAKRAIVVGDVRQLPPVEDSDAPMYGPVIARKHQVYDDEALARGLLCGLSDPGADVWVDRAGSLEIVEGSVMRAASAASGFDADIVLPDGSRPGPGMWLVDHFRCDPRIIEFSNSGWYGGMLNARTTEIDGQICPFPLSHIDVRDGSQGEGQRENRKEAELISLWIKRNMEGLIAEYGGEDIGDVVAVLTPFRMQARLLRKTLKTDLGEIAERIVCGTVHSLQGAEKPIVMFSTVYSGAFFTEAEATGAEKQYFFDRQHTLLNVAASRAKRNFVVVGDQRVFVHSGEGSPTYLLANRLRAWKPFAVAAPVAIA